MPEHGGTTTWSGISFQAKVTVYYLAELLNERVTGHRDPIFAVRAEAPTAVDDLLITRSSGARSFQSVKEGLRLSSQPDTPWVRMWQSFYLLRCGSIDTPTDFNPTQDVMTIICPETDVLRHNLKEVINIRGASSLNAIEFLTRLSAPQKQIIENLKEILKVNDDFVLELLKCMKVRSFGDEESMHDLIQSLLTSIYPFDSERRITLSAALMNLVVKEAKNRKEFDFITISKELLPYEINLDEAVSAPFKVVPHSVARATVREAREFYRGFEATWETVHSGIPVGRTCYIEQRKDLLLQEAEELDGSGKLRAVVITGPRGVGKTTVAKHIAVDLSRADHLVVWFDAYPRRLHKELVPQFRNFLARQRRVHLFADGTLSSAKTHSSSRSDHVLTDLSEFLRAIGLNSRVTLYLTVDSNHYELIREDLESALQSSPVPILLPLNLDDHELKSLIKSLTEWDALGKLAGRQVEEITQIFQRKSHKILLVALIEALEGNSDRDNFHNIIRSEYEALPVNSQMAYPLVALGHAYNTGIPIGLFFSALENLPGANARVGLEEFRKELRDVLMINRELVFTRHPIIARTLCEALASAGGYSAEDSLWMPMIGTLLNCIDTNDASHTAYIQEFAATKVLSILTARLDDLGKGLSEGLKWRNLTPQIRGQLLNAIARVYQGRGNLGSAISWASISRNSTWVSDLNGAIVILMYCYLSTQNIREALSLARQIASKPDNVWHLLHSVRIMSRCGEAREAAETISKFENQLRRVPAFSDLKAETMMANVGYQDLDEDDDPWSRARWVHSRLALGQIPALEAIDYLTEILEEEPNVHRAYTDLCHLHFVEKRYEDVIRLSDQIVSAVSAAQNAKTANRKINVKETSSMALATKAWAMFRRDGATSRPLVEDLFRESLTLKPDNAWCHNWRGMFLHFAEPESGIAEKELREAIRLNKNVPPFYRNLAKTILETNVSPFIRSKNQEVIDFCQIGISLCPENSYWNWGGLLAELESLSYCAESLDKQHLPDGTTLLGELVLGIENEYVD